ETPTPSDREVELEGAFLALTESYLHNSSVTVGAQMLAGVGYDMRYGSENLYGSLVDACRWKAENDLKPDRLRDLWPTPYDQLDLKTGTYCIFLLTYEQNPTQDNWVATIPYLEVAHP